MISVYNLVRQTITYSKMLCVILWNGLIQLNEISAGKPIMFVHFVVCLYAKSDGWKYLQELSSKTSWQFVCLFIERNSYTGTF